MKDFKFIHRFGSVALMAMAVLSSAPSLVSCSGEGSPDDPSFIAEDQPTVTIKVFTPVLNRTNLSATRAGDDDASAGNDTSSLTSVSKAETALTSLYLFIFNAGASADDKPFRFVNCTTKITDLDNNNLNTQFTGIYQAPIKAGKYRFYVVANLDSYLPLAEGQNAEDYLKELSENDLKTLSLNFYAPLTLKSENSSGLPMFVSASEMTVPDITSVNKDPNGTIDLSNPNLGNITIQGEMTILCAKVRYTFLFDNSVVTTSTTDNSLPNSYNYSYPYKSFKVNSISIKRIFTKTPLIGEGKWDKAYSESLNRLDEYDNIPGNHYPYPTSLLDKDGNRLFPTIDDFTKSPVDLSGDATDENRPRAYQGTVYLPENCNTSADGKSIMQLAAIIDGENIPYDIILPNNNNKNCDPDLTHSDSTPGENILLRGHFYDVIGKITASGMQFYVKVNPWIVKDKEYFDF